MGRKKSNAVSSFPNSSDIPEDVIVDILSRLPRHSLRRFTCVSKQWSSLISTITATKGRSRVVLIISGSVAYFFSPHSIGQRQVLQLQLVHVPWEKKSTPLWALRILGSCNGLLLISMYEDVFLWNPLTTFFKKVLAYHHLRGLDYGICSGLSYDINNDEYKAVLALSFLSPSMDGGFVVVGCFRRKSWTMVDVPYRVPSMNSGPVVDRKLHWFASKKNSGNHFLSPHQIIYFNAHMDKFEEVPMPEPRAEDGDIICGLGVLDECLSMSRLVQPGNSESNVEVLIMKEYGVKTSWTILFTASNSFTFRVNDTLVPLGYTKNGEVLCEVLPPYNGDRQISAFNLTNNTHRRILEHHHHLAIHVIVHEGSLVTPTDHHWEEEELKGEATYMAHGYDYWQKMKKNKYGFWTSL